MTNTAADRLRAALSSEPVSHHRIELLDVALATARAEAAQRVVERVPIKTFRRLVKAAEMARRNLQGTTPCYCASSPHEGYCGDLIHAVSAANLVLADWDAFAAIGDSAGEEEGQP